MAHPYQMHREHHVERERVKHITGEHEGHRDHEHVYHRARGGHVDAAEDRAMVKSMVKGEALKHGHKGKHRADKRARGGKVKHKGKTVVNVNVAPQQSAPHPMPVPMPPPGAGAAPPPRPPMPAPGGAPGMPPGGMPPPGMPPRATGGRVAGFATGGPVFSEKIAKMGPKPTGSAKGSKPRTGNKDFSEHGSMAPHGDSGAGGGVSRAERNHRAGKVYHKTPPAIHTPGMRND